MEWHRDLPHADSGNHQEHFPDCVDGYPDGYYYGADGN